MSGLTPADVESLWVRLDDEAQASKFSQQALERLAQFYGGLNADERCVVDGVLKGWVHLEINSRRRFDALAIISRFDVVSALPVLRDELVSLDRAEGPSVQFERKKITRIIEKLERR